jgi:hypothetical protein
MKSILDPRFKYTNSVDTDLRKTFARVRREQVVASRPPAPPPEPAKVTTLRKAAR